MRNTDSDPRSAWATFAKAARLSAKVGQAELARRLDVERSTIWRWETGKQKPENAETVRVFAEALDIDLDEALAAAGLRPGVEAPTEPTREFDDEELMILRADVDQKTKEDALEQLHRMKLRDKRRRMEDIEFFLRRRDTA